MKKIFLVIIFFYCFSAYAQWNSFYTNQKPYFKIKDNQFSPVDTTIQQFHFDTIVDYGNFKVMHSNYTNPDFNGCYDVVNQNFGSYNYIYSKQYIRPDSVLLLNDSTYFFYENTSVLFLPQSKPNDVWTSPINNSSNYNTIQFTCDSVGVGNVLLNINDSLKYFSVKAYQNTTPVTSVYDNLTIILSKNYGFKQFIAFRDYNQQAFNLVGLDSANVKTGFSYPDFSTYFHLSVGDVIIWEEYSPFAGPTHMGYTKYHKDSVTYSLITPDSVIYNFSRVTTGGGNTYNYTTKYLRSNFTGLNTTSSVYTMGTKISPEYFFGLMGGELFETYGAYITNDTVINRFYYYVGFSLDTSNCSVGITTDAGYQLEYNTYYGLSAYASESWTSTYFTVTGSTINGVQEGDDWATIIASVNENDVDKLIQIYPNPSNDGNITVKHGGVSHLDVYSIDGKLIFSKAVGNNEQETNIQLPKGMYLVHAIKNTSLVSVLKVVVTG